MSENNIPNTNADAQESADGEQQAEATTATTNAPETEAQASETNPTTCN